MFLSSLSRKILYLFFVGLVLMVLGTSENLYAIETTSVLPKGISSPAFYYGIVGNVGQKFDENGDLRSLNDLNSVYLDPALLAREDQRVAALVAALNSFGHQNAGDSLSLGTLKVTAAPQVTYQAPVFAYGLTDRLTLAIGIPIIHYKNDVQITQTSTNIPELKKLYAGIPEILEPLTVLEQNMASTAKGALIRKGYRSIENRDEKFLGDVQLVTMYKLYDDKTLSLQGKLNTTLPTGPEPDADDLLDIGSFHQTALEPQLLSGLYASRWLQIVGRIGYRKVLPDKVEKRVPKNENDTIPDKNRKEQVNRQIGDSMNAAGTIQVGPINRVRGAMGYQYTQKSSDQYSGSKFSNYDLLSKSTNQSSHIMRYELSYDTVTAYLAGQTSLPMIISYEFSDLISGKNIGRQSIHEFRATFFF